MFPIALRGTRLTGSSRHSERALGDIFVQSDFARTISKRCRTFKHFTRRHLPRSVGELVVVDPVKSAAITRRDGVPSDGGIRYGNRKPFGRTTRGNDPDEIVPRTQGRVYSRGRFSGVDLVAARGEGKVFAKQSDRFQTICAPHIVLGQSNDRRDTVQLNIMFVTDDDDPPEK